jgi:hypothetical protein
MAPSSDDKEKTPPEDDYQDLQLKEEVKSEAVEEEMEEDESTRPSTMIASIGVVTSHDKFKKSARIRTGGRVPRHILAPRTSPSGNNPFHTLIHEHQIQIIITVFIYSHFIYLYYQIPLKTSLLVFTVNP